MTLSKINSLHLHGVSPSGKTNVTASKNKKHSTSRKFPNKKHLFAEYKRALNSPLRQRSAFSFKKWIQYGVYGLVFLSIGIISLYVHPDSNLIFEPIPKSETSTQFFFFDQEGIQYSLQGDHSHGVAENFDFMLGTPTQIPLDFLDTGLPQENHDSALSTSGESLTQKISDLYVTGQVEDYFTNLRGDLFHFFEFSGISLSGDQQKGKIFVPLGKLVLKELDLPIVNPTSPESSSGIHILDHTYTSCTTPRGSTLEHGDSVLAYEQTAQIYDTCNLERRYCNNGKLSGSFRYNFCRVQTSYNNYQDTFVAYEEQKPSDLIQPSPKPTYNLENYPTNTHGIDEYWDAVPNHSYTREGFPSDPLIHSNEVPLSPLHEQSCRTPRGEKVPHGQFVKAYKHTNGFSDHPCEVQIRLCANGELGGTFREAYCRVWDTSYIDRLNHSPTRDTISQEKMELIKQRRKEEVTYTPEDINFFDSPYIDLVLRLLDHYSDE